MPKNPKKQARQSANKSTGRKGASTIEGLNSEKQEIESNINFWLGRIKATKNKQQLKVAKKRLRQEQKEYKKIFQKLEQLTGNNLRLLQN